MNGFAALQRFAPLVAFAQKDAGSLSDKDLGTIATALAGPQAQSFVPLLAALRKAAPEAKGLEILGTPEAGQIYEKMRQQAAEENRTIFCQCPSCGFKYEDEIGNVDHPHG